MKKSSKIVATVLSLGIGATLLTGCSNDYGYYFLDNNSNSSTYDNSSVNDDSSYDVSSLDDTTNDTSNTVDDNNNSVYDTSEQAAPSQQVTDPQIGDTEDQVLNSTWGSPTDKTETKDAYGTSAMWFYDGMKSIFFVDGKVNSISQ